MMRFAVDCNAGRLARWLRALGHDASYERQVEDAELVRRALAEDRVLLTRDRDLTRRRVIQSGRLRAVLLRDDDLASQLRQVVLELGLSCQARLTRCLECNLPLLPRLPAEVVELVPPYVRRTQTRYSQCPGCSRVYWAGTHWRRMRETVAALA
ncbi:MAG: hypothetical protein E6J29_08675 [Chloroflexi bacterium]|nr:MAG: hypothetical protein E6J29_08675 [Chloroflexota bacterium]